jgi:hypothetical protein
VAHFEKLNCIKFFSWSIFVVFMGTITCLFSLLRRGREHRRASACAGAAAPSPASPPPPPAGPELAALIQRGHPRLGYDSIIICVVQ